MKNEEAHPPTLLNSSFEIRNSKFLRRVGAPPRTAALRPAGSRRYLCTCGVVAVHTETGPSERLIVFTTYIPASVTGVWATVMPDVDVELASTAPVGLRIRSCVGTPTLDSATEETAVAPGG